MSHIEADVFVVSRQQIDPLFGQVCINDEFCCRLMQFIEINLTHFMMIKKNHD